MELYFSAIVTKTTQHYRLLELDAKYAANMESKTNILNILNLNQKNFHGLCYNSHCNLKIRDGDLPKRSLLYFFLIFTMQNKILLKLKANI